MTQKKLKVPWSLLNFRQSSKISLLYLFDLFYWYGKLEIHENQLNIRRILIDRRVIPRGKIVKVIEALGRRSIDGWDRR